MNPQARDRVSYGERSRSFIQTLGWQVVCARGLALCVAIVAFLLTAACNGGGTVTWSAESRSPDGRWLAVARTTEYGGFGTASTETTVELRDTSAPSVVRSSQQVLGFMNDGPALALKMSWLSSEHLDVTYRGDPKILYFQVVKTSGLEISTSNVLGSAGSRQ